MFSLAGSENLVVVIVIKGFHKIHTSFDFLAHKVNSHVLVPFRKVKALISWLRLTLGWLFAYNVTCCRLIPLHFLYEFILL